MPDAKRIAKRLAVIGGTFDPIHYGHLAAAEAARVTLGAGEVLFVPSGDPPHKDGALLTHGEHRYLMCVLATADNPYFKVSRMELERPGKSYTIDTIRELRLETPDETEIFFITGADALNEILTWKDAEELVRLCGFVSVTRPGYVSGGVLPGLSANIIHMDAPAFDISSSDIRERIRGGRTVRYLIPEPVRAYIDKHTLYAASDMLAEKINEYIKAALTKKRYEHTLGVTGAAVRLAARYGEDREKARLAALLHDCAKDLSEEETYAYMERYGVAPDDVTKTQIGLTHPFIAAGIAREKFGIEDGEILDAIRYHTIGRENMSRLEKIIYVADCIDESRDYYGGLELIREAAFTDLDRATAAGLKAAINYTLGKGRPVHPQSRKALEYIIDRGEN